MGSFAGSFTIEELIDLLGQMAKETDSGLDTEVRVANQPAWPFEHIISKVVLAPDADEYPTPNDGETLQVVYIGVGDQVGYLPTMAKQELGW